MSATYSSIAWNKHKVRYDWVLWIFNLLFIAVSFIVNLWLFPQYNPGTLLIRSFGLLSLLLLHAVLLIGPLCRINPLFLPLLFNRRHLGVSLFLIASVHALYSLWWFHGNGNVHALISLFTSNLHYNSLAYFPFQVLGFLAYLILMVMAFTSHDFWLAAFTPRVWKALHMSVYVAYFLLVMHVALGIGQFESNWVLYGFLLLGLLLLSVVHIWAGILSLNKGKDNDNKDGVWIKAGQLQEWEENRARLVVHQKQRMAIFKYNGKLSAVNNICKHQQGPLSEGKVVDGCITCPWHGYQYNPSDGCAPAPFTEKLSTYRLKLQGQEVWVDPRPLEEGNYVEPLLIPEGIASKEGAVFYNPWPLSISHEHLKAIRKFVIPFVFLALSFLVLFSFSQQHIAPSIYKADEPAELKGVVSNQPFPHLAYVSAKDVYGNPVVKVLPLVNAWKFGAAPLLNEIGADTARVWVQLNGTLIQRGRSLALDLNTGKPISCGENKSGKICDSVSMMELSDGRSSIRYIQNVPLNFPNPQAVDAGITTISGEIVDSKCYLGAMNPGEGKPHRSCAVRCISGGIMPVLVYTERGEEKQVVLVGKKNLSINNDVLPFVAAPVRVNGRLFHFANWDYLEVESVQSL